MPSREMPPKLVNIRNYFRLILLYMEMSGLCPRIDYRLQWGNDGQVLVNLLTFFRLRAPHLWRNSAAPQAILASFCLESRAGFHTCLQLRNLPLPHLQVNWLQQHMA
jgi:hypothetical protein